ncbi:NAD(P)H-hydrate epimerase [Roseibaca calidilacus]
MTEILTPAQMRATEQAAIDSGAVTGLALMEQAGAATRDSILSYWPGLARDRAHARVLCGPGNNGGDGYVIARLLMDRGWKVQVVAFGAPDHLPPDARRNFDRYEGALLDGATAPRPFEGDLSVDAVFGTGLSRPISDPTICGWLVEHDRFTTRVGASVAVDIPSGLDANSGKVLDGSACARSALTVTFHRAKPGHYLAQGPDYCGALHVAGIGL